MKDDERLSGAPMFYVYYLLDEAGTLLYIGRAQNPHLRRAAFERKHGILVTHGIPQRHRTLEAAADAERAAIRRHKPPYNHKVSSTKGMTGRKHSAETRAAIGAKHAGKTQTAEARLKMRRAALGRPGPKHTEAGRQKMSAVNKGKTMSLHTRELLRQAQLRVQAQKRAQRAK